MTSKENPPSSARINWRQVESWATEIAAGEIAAIRAVFAARSARGPTIAWRPTVAQLAPPQLAFLLRYWLDLAGDRSMPAASEIDPLQMRPALGYLILVDVVEDGRDLRYRLFGSTLAAVSGFDMTGQLVSQHRASPYVVEFALATYRAVLTRREPVLTEHGPPATIETTAWRRLVLPLSGPDGTVIRLLVGNLPISRSGQPVQLRL
jgi:hypothetical protein